MYIEKLWYILIVCTHYYLYIYIYLIVQIMRVKCNLVVKSWVMCKVAAEICVKSCMQPTVKDRMYCFNILQTLTGAEGQLCIFVGG